MKTLRTGLTILLCGLFLALDVQAAVIAPELETALQGAAGGEEIPVIVKLTKKVDPKLFKDKDKRIRRFKLLQALKAYEDTDQEPLKRFAEGTGGSRVKTLRTANALALRVRPNVIRMLANVPGVASISLDADVHAPVTQFVSTATPEWNINAVTGPDLWALGFKGQGVVVANLDTGVDVSHPDLAAQWRGGSNGWYDPNGEHPSPYDVEGHGTQVMSVMVGRDAGGSAIGMAPDAKWIAVKIFNDAGVAQLSTIHQGLQWVLDPDGDPATDDAPDVVNLSWGIGAPDACDLEFQADLDILKAAGVAVVLSAGNSGPSASTSVSPANNPGQVSTGAVDEAMNVTSFSSRGPSACPSGNGPSVFPTVVAPGEGIRTADLSFGGLPLYALVSGTSFATPHVAGAMALLLSAAPSSTVAELESALTESAIDLGATGPDHDAGHGLIDTLAAYNILKTSGGPPPDAAGEATLISVNFNATADGFVYADSGFTPAGAANTDAYESGVRVATGGVGNSGALSVTLGGLDNNTRTNLSGHWSRGFTLAAPATLTLSFAYNLTLLPDYESDEYGEVRVSLDGVDLVPFVARLTGNGNGGGNQTTGLQPFTVVIPNVPAGAHTLRIGGFNNKKTFNNEQTSILIDDVLLTR